MIFNKYSKVYIKNIYVFILKLKYFRVHFFLLIVLILLFGENINPADVVYFTFLVASTAYIDIFVIVTPKLTLFFPEIFFNTCCPLS